MDKFEVTKKSLQLIVLQRIEIANSLLLKLRKIFGRYVFTNFLAKYFISSSDVGKKYYEIMLREFLSISKEIENPETWTPQLKKELYEACRTIIKHEDAFIDLAFEMGPMQGLTANDVKQYIRFIANRRLTQLGLEGIYDVQKNPLGWLDTMLNAVEHMNFFEGRATEYSKASTQGTWSEVFS